MINTNKVLGNILGNKPKGDKKSKNKKKIIVNEWFKTYDVMDVSDDVYNNSPDKEQAGTTTAFKIKDDNHLNFLVNELKSKGFKKD